MPNPRLEEFSEAKLYAASLLFASIAGVLMVGFFKLSKWFYTYCSLLKDYLFTSLLIRQAQQKLQLQALSSTTSRSFLARELLEALRTTYLTANNSAIMLENAELKLGKIEHPLVMLAEQLAMYFDCVQRAAAGRPFAVSELEDSLKNAHTCITLMETQKGGLRFRGGDSAVFAETRKLLMELDKYVLEDIAKRHKRKLYQLSAKAEDRNHPK